jgi:hypothetical protein
MTALGRLRRHWGPQVSAFGTSAKLNEGQSQFGFAPVVQTSTCSAMASASSTSMPRYPTVLSIFVCPKERLNKRAELGFGHGHC